MACRNARAGLRCVVAVLIANLIATGPQSRAEDDPEAALSALKAPLCMSADESVAYQTNLSLATSVAILERCKASFAGQLDSKRVAAIEKANERALQQPGSVMRGINERAREPFRRAYPGRDASTFADVLAGDLASIMGEARPETLESCREVIGLWGPRVEDGAWEETLVRFGETTFRRNAIRRRRAFPICE